MSGDHENSQFFDAEDDVFDPESLTAYRRQKISPIKAEGAMPQQHRGPPAAHVDVYRSIPMPTSMCYDEVLLRADVNCLYGQLSSLIRAKPKLFTGVIGDENTEPSANPMYWISKWIDYTTEYGFGYQVSDKCIGVLYNDRTTLIVFLNGFNVHYIDQNGSRMSMTRTHYPQSLQKKMKVLGNFKQYMTDNTVTTGSKYFQAAPKDDGPESTPYVNYWFRSACGMVMHLSNGLLQMNFGGAFGHEKLLLCPHKGAITYLDRCCHLRTYLCGSIIAHGCGRGLFQNLLMLHQHLAHIIQQV